MMLLLSFVVAHDGLLCYFITQLIKLSVQCLVSLFILGPYVVSRHKLGYQTLYRETFLGRRLLELL